MISNPDIPREKAELAAICSLPGATAGRVREMLSLFGSPSGAWQAIRAGKARGTPAAGPLEEWASLAAGREPHKELDEFERAGISTVVRGEEGYPERLDEIFDSPWVLYYRGRLSVPGTCTVAIVGSRKATPYGLEVSRWLARELALRDVNVVSGAAYGVDSAAHAGALEDGGFTTAVLGCGVDVVYPRSNASLMERIRASGCLLSEYPPGTPPSRVRFPERNRIMAGMSRLVVVVEAAPGSGALITVDHALAAGRDVMAVPGPILSANSAGTNALIRTGASPVTCPEDLLAELGMSRAVGVSAQSALPADTNKGEPDLALLSRALGRGFTTAEELSREAGLPVPDTLAALSRMEVRGSVVRGPGGCYHLAAD